MSDPHLGDLVEKIARRSLTTLEVDRRALLQRYSYVDALQFVVTILEGNTVDDALRHGKWSMAAAE